MFNRALIAAAASFSIVLAGTAGADDTDIYLDPDTAGGDALVMFTLDNRPSTTSTYGGCSNVGSAGSYCNAAQAFVNLGIAASDLPASSSPLTFLDALRLALKVAFSRLPSSASGIKVGLMLNHARDQNCNPTTDNNCSVGAYVSLGFTSLADGAASQLDTKLKAVRYYGTDTRGLNTSGNFGGHSYQGMGLFFEFFRYLTGQNIWAGHAGYDDYNKPTNGSNATTNLDTYVNANYSGTSIASLRAQQLLWDTSVEDTGENAGKYISPLNSLDGCGKIFTINLFFGNSQDGSAVQSTSAIRAPLASGGMALGSNPTFEEAIAFLKGKDLAAGIDEETGENEQIGRAEPLAGTQNVTSFFFSNGNLQNTVNGYANAGGTGTSYLMDEDPEALVEAFERIFSQILSVSSTFVSASVPANVFNRAEITNNLFVALFKAETLSYWTGNIKRLKLEEDSSGDFSVVDALGTPAVDIDGRINDLALTLWTNSAGRDVIETTELDADLTPSTTSRRNGTTGRDGRDTYRGGAGQNIPGFLGTSDVTAAGNPGTSNAVSGARQLYYAASYPGLPNSTPVALTALNYSATPSATLKSKLGMSSNTDAEAAAVLRYIRGYKPSPDDFARRWLFGDPMHSRPLPINYGTRGGYATSTETKDNQAIYLAVGSNDGFLRFIQNSLPDASGSAASGKELWAFMPDEGLAIQKRLFDNNDATAFQYANHRHPYGVDGAPVALITDSSGAPKIVPDDASDKVYLYFGLRRGGKSYYALDISDPAAPPSLLWRISNTTGGYEDLALTFSRPQLGRIRIGTTYINVLVFGGGYDHERNDYYRTSSEVTDKGNAVFIVNAATGELVKKATLSGMTRSVAAEVTIADTDRNGLTDRIVFGDVGGKIWRIDIPAGEPAENWPGHLVADLASTDVFFHAVDLVQTQDSVGNYDAIIVGSGDRENPLDCTDTGTMPCNRNSSPPSNRVYVIKDRDTVVRAIDPDTGIEPAYSSSISEESLTDITDCIGEECNYDLTNGWRLELETTGEKALSTPFTFQGTIFFTTYIPVPVSTDEATLTCGPSEGSGRFYAVKLADGAPSYDLETGGGTTKEDRYRDLQSGGIPAEVVYLENGRLLLPDLQDFDTESRAFLRTYWRREGR